MFEINISKESNVLQKPNDPSSVSIRQSESSSSGSLTPLKQFF